MPALYKGQEDETLHRRAIEKLAREIKPPISRVKAVYEDEYARLQINDQREGHRFSRNIRQPAGTRYFAPHARVALPARVAPGAVRAPANDNIAQALARLLQLLPRLQSLLSSSAQAVATPLFGSAELPGIVAQPPLLT